MQAKTTTEGLQVILHKETIDTKLGLTLSLFANDVGHPRVQLVKPGSIAAACGQFQPMDIVMAVNGITISSDKQAREIIGSSVGDVVFTVRPH